MSAMVWYQYTDAGMICFDASVTQFRRQHEQSQQPSSLISSTLPLLAPDSRALAYGDGFFTTMGVYQSKVLWQHYHDARLSSHTQALHLYLSSIQRQQLWQAVIAFANNIKHGVVKIIIGRKTQTLRGYAFSSKLTDNICDIYVGVMQTLPLATQAIQLPNVHSKSSIQNSTHVPTSNIVEPILCQDPVTAVCLESQLACLPENLAGLKSLNRLDSVLVAGELETYKQRSEHSDNIGEGLVQDMAGDWLEGVMSNVFYQLGSKTKNDKTCDHNDSGQWFTPPLISSGVRGVMRQVIVDKCARSNVAIVFRALDSKDLHHIKAMFFCNAVRGVIPVDKLILPSGQVLKLSLPEIITNSAEI